VGKPKLHDAWARALSAEVQAAGSWRLELVELQYFHDDLPHAAIKALIAWFEDIDPPPVAGVELDGLRPFVPAPDGPTSARWMIKISKYSTGAVSGRPGGPPPSREQHPPAGRTEAGLGPAFTKDLKEARKPSNARAESVATAGMFRGAFAAPPRLGAASCPPGCSTNGRRLAPRSSPMRSPGLTMRLWPSAASGKAGNRRMAKSSARSRSSPAPLIAR
jgi:hypothetical protein